MDYNVIYTILPFQFSSQRSIICLCRAVCVFFSFHFIRQMPHNIILLASYLLYNGIFFFSHFLGCYNVIYGSIIIIFASCTYLEILFNVVCKLVIKTTKYDFFFVFFLLLLLICFVVVFFRVICHEDDVYQLWQMGQHCDGNKITP